MARSTELGECVARVLGIRPTAAASHVRNLREAGLLTKTGRGITGAHMTPRDAAHLLIAATCSQDIQDSVNTVGRYGRLERVGRNVQEEAFPTLAALAERSIFAEALATLLDSKSINFLENDPRSTVVVTFTHPSPEILLELSVKGANFARYYRPPGTSRTSPTTRIPNQDLQVRYRFSEQTICTVGKLLRGEDRS